MAEEFRLPDIGEGLVEAEVVRWLVAVGEPVQVDQPVVELESDKATVEMPSPFAGTLLHQGAAEGETLEVGKVLFVVGDADEAWPANDRTDGPSERGPVVPSGADAPPIVGSLSEDAQDLTASVPPEGAGRGRGLKALPSIRKHAAELGVDLGSVTGTGPGGRITRADVEAAAASAPAPSPSATRERAVVAASGPLVRKQAAELGVDLGLVTGTGPGGRITRADVDAAARLSSGADQAIPAAAGAADERRPLSRLRRTIAANMTRAWAEIPRVTAFDDVDATRLLAVRQALQVRHGVKVPIDALVVAAVVPALRAHPEFNASLEGDELVVHHRHDIGVAVDTPDGLMVAVVRDGGSMSLLPLAEEIRRLGQGARTRSLTVAELTGQTFTISNIGAVGGGFGTPMVPVGTVGILSVGRAADRPVARDGRVEVAPVMPLSFSFDHRIADGAAGRAFLAILIENLSEPALFLA